MKKNLEIQGVSELALQEQLIIDGGAGPLALALWAVGGLAVGLAGGLAITKWVSTW